ncbi:SH3 and PX-domain-containing 3 [Mycena venus]|uniref:SH3 and PX-domain-containing 3 n=1 Tax=Mycena venus TaxID=2733690 RepID=A0A8H6YGE0_9AGAR|nr:SH3 and PX-domain-containing 3 [Mycena venus]
MSGSVRPRRTRHECGATSPQHVGDDGPQNFSHTTPFMKDQRLWQLTRLQSVWARLCVVCVVSLLLLWVFLGRHESHPPWTTFPPMTVDSLAQELGHPTFPDIRFYERNLPQHVVPSLLSKGKDRPRYLFLPQETWGSGWNNILQEQLLNTHLAYLSQRSYVFPDYIARDHPPLPDTLANGVRHWLHIPINAFMSGPTAGGPLSSSGQDDLMRRSVSHEWWSIVCPPMEVVVVNLQDTMRELELDDVSDGADIMARWAAKLLDMAAPCVSIVSSDSGKAVFDYKFIGSKRVLSIWPSYGNSPALKNFAWSPLITAALFRNFHLLSSDPPPQFLTPTGGRPYRFRSFPPYNPSAEPIKGLLGIHLRRGDFERHCARLAKDGLDYNAWNQLGTPGLSTRPASQGSSPPDYVWPAIPDYLDVPEGQSRKDAAFAHCWPSAESILARVNSVRESAASGVSFPPQNLHKIFMATNGSPSWIDNLTAHLQADGWEVSTSFEMDLTLEEHVVAQAVDMSVLTGAESFIGAGFSSMSSNVVQIRLAGGRDPGTIHFW